MKPVVGVGFMEADPRHDWITRLTPRLGWARVVDVDRVEPSSVDVLVVGNPPGSELTRFGSLRFVQSTWAGVDRLVIDAPPVPIARMVAPDLKELMTEFVLAAVLTVHRSFPAYRRDQSRHRWLPRPTRLARESTVGVLGYGELGRPAAHALAEVGFDVVAWARTARSERVEVLSGEAGLWDVLGRSDTIVNLLPLTDRTRAILDDRALAAMPRGAALVNAGRGAHVVEGALLDALDSERLSEAVLDVFDEEPLPSDHPFWSHPRVTILPHVAAPSRPADLVAHVAANIASFLEGDSPRFLVRP